MKRLKTIQNSMILTFTLLLLATVLLLGTMSFYLFSNVIRENTEKSTSQLITQLNNVIDTYIAYMIDIANVAAESGPVQELLDIPAAAAQSPEAHSLRGDVGVFFNSLRTIRNDISAITLILENGEAITSSPEKEINPAVDIYGIEGFLQLKAQPQSIYLSPGHVQNLIKDEYPWVISLGRSVLSRREGAFAGMLMVDLNYELIEEICMEVELGKRGYVFLVNENGDLVYHPRQQLIYSNLKNEYIDEVLELKNGNLAVVIDEEDILYTVNTSANTGWTLVGVSFLDEINSYKKQLSTIYILLALLGFSLLVLLSIILSSRISSPIEQLRESMREVERGNFDIDIKVNSNNEVRELAQDCKIAIMKIRDLLEQNELEQDIKRKNELKALQAQINPHFLYNTLDSIIWMAECEMNEEVVEMTTALAEFFRLGISKGSEIVSVRSMIEHIRSYLIIQKMRYKDKLDYSLDISPDIYSFRTLKLLIQPLVENSIYHGLKEKETGGIIKIRGRLSSDRCLVFEVEDNGIGISEESFEQLLHNRSDLKTGSGIGLRNVQERIKLFFGDQYGLVYKSVVGKGTIFTITLPAIEQERE
jgi:two-component system, sensor histidine kinase YesM